MALLKRELHRQEKGPEITHADRCTLVFDTDTKRLYVESEVAHFEAKLGGTVEYQTTTMDIADFLTQGGQTAGHRELWRLLRSLFNQNRDRAEYTDESRHLRQVDRGGAGSATSGSAQTSQLDARTLRPENWAALRRQWEYSHAVNAGVTFLAFCLATASAIRK